MNNDQHGSELLQPDARRAALWGAVQQRFGGPVGVLVVFLFAHSLLVFLGYAFKENVDEPTLMWPSAGLLFAALWISDRRIWPAFLALHVLVEFTFAALLQDPFVPGLALLFTCANALDSIVGATIARWMIRDPGQVRTGQTLSAIFAAIVGGAAGAVVGAAINASGAYSTQDYLHQVQIWWAGSCLGTLTVAPVVFCWCVPVRHDFPQLALRSRLEVFVLAVLLAAASYNIFSTEPGSTASILGLPIVTIALLVYSAVRLPPRWAATLAMGTALLCAKLASDLRGPFVAGDIFNRTAQMQTFLLMAVGITYVLATAMAEKRITLARLRDSDARYRNFVEQSTEAVWRVELEQPMPVSLPTVEQIAWLRRHARVVEFNAPFRQLDPADLAGKQAAWRQDVPWVALYEQNVEQAARQGYCLEGGRFVIAVQGGLLTFITTYSGVVQNGHLLRLWGVARDITELTDLNARLQREQERLKFYARQIVTAEEKARRATAVDLHDGIGQSLTGMAMTLQVARERVPADVGALLDEVRERLREVQERTRHMISDLSPPGLYDLGLMPALQWLAIYMRSHDHLHVDVQAQVIEQAIALDIRVLVFKLVRELLRNVVKHAEVESARVSVYGDQAQLRVVVEDEGKGFEWQLDMLGARGGGFGLWSIADRVQEANGRFIVDAAPGRGSRFELVFSLQVAGAVTEIASIRKGVA